MNKFIAFYLFGRLLVFIKSCHSKVTSGVDGDAGINANPLKEITNSGVSLSFARFAVFRAKRHNPDQHLHSFVIDKQGPTAITLTKQQK